MMLILCKAVWRLIELKALVASTRRAASISESWKILRIAWTAASQPPSWPAHSWSGLAAASTSLLTILSTAFAIMHLGTSPTPMGLTPGHLLRGIRQQATRALKPSGWIRVVAICLPTPANAVQRLVEADLNDEHMRRQACASRPEGPAAP